jgi:hypothetical protein
MGARTRGMCRDYFNKLNISPLQSQCILLLVLCVINNQNQFVAKSEILETSIIFISHCLFWHQKGSYFVGIMVFSSLPDHTKNLANNMKQFKWDLKVFFMYFIFIHWMSVLIIIKVKSVVFVWTLQIFVCFNTWCEYTHTVFVFLLNLVYTSNNYFLIPFHTHHLNKHLINYFFLLCSISILLLV